MSSRSNAYSSEQTNIPPGLEYLSTLDGIFVKQQLDLVEMVVNYEQSNQYYIMNQLGQRILFAREDSNICCRQICRTKRPWDMIVRDNFGREVIRVSRPYRCGTCCFPCCRQKCDVYSCTGELLGSVHEDFSIFSPSFTIYNSQGEQALSIHGTCCAGRLCCPRTTFHLYDRDRQNIVGKISKEWSGLIREHITDSDFFGITFPYNLDVKMKAVMLGALFLIDFKYFEE